MKTSENYEIALELNTKIEKPLSIDLVTIAKLYIDNDPKWEENIEQMAYMAFIKKLFNDDNSYRPVNLRET